MRINHRKATYGDAVSLSERLRPEDIDEIKAASSGGTPLDSLLHGVRWGEPAMTIYRVADGLPIAMYGVVPSEPYAKLGIVWMLASKEIETGPLCVEFLRRCKDVVEHLQDSYTVLTNIIDSRNHLHVRWITWCGFEITGVLKPDGVTKFYRFQRKRKRS